MDLAIANNRNGAAWITDCLVDQPLISRACERLNACCRTGIRHFSAIRVVVPLDRAAEMERRIARLEDELAPNEGVACELVGSDGRINL